MFSRATTFAGILMAAAATAAYAEPAHNLDLASQLREGVSTRDDAIHLLGQPVSEDRINGCTMCTWADERRAISLHFGPTGILEDRKEWRH
jgi:hypothetical protein